MKRVVAFGRSMLVPDNSSTPAAKRHNTGHGAAGGAAAASHAGHGHGTSSPKHVHGTHRQSGSPTCASPTSPSHTNFRNAFHDSNLHHNNHLQQQPHAAKAHGRGVVHDAQGHSHTAHAVPGGVTPAAKHAVQPHGHGHHAQQHQEHHQGHGQGPVKDLIARFEHQ